MSIDTTSAKNCFAENIENFASAKVEPEKFNLYNGLWNLTGAIAQLEAQIQTLTQQVDELSKRAK